MPKATVRASARTLLEATSRRALLGAVLATSAVAVAPSRAEADVGVEPELQALIAAWHETYRRLEETYDASCAADDRALCPVPQAFIATENDSNQWCHAIVGREYDERDVIRLRRWMAIPRPNGPSELNVVPGTEFDDRANEIIASWDSWQAEQRAAREREGTAEAKALWNQAVEDYHAMGSRVAKLQAKTMAGVIAKLLAAAPHVTEDDLEDPTSSGAVLASAALDGLALNARGEGRAHDEPPPRGPSTLACWSGGH
jgi:hypothetical protein